MSSFLQVLHGRFRKYMLYQNYNLMKSKNNKFFDDFHFTTNLTMTSCTTGVKDRKTQRIAKINNLAILMLFLKLLLFCCEIILEYENLPINS